MKQDQIFTVIYQQGSTTHTIERAKFVNGWIGENFHEVGQAILFAQFEDLATSDYISLVASTIVSIKAVR